MGEKWANAETKRSGIERSDDICHLGLYLLWVNDRLGGCPPWYGLGIFFGLIFLKGMVMYYWALALFFKFIYILQPKRPKVPCSRIICNAKMALDQSSSDAGSTWAMR